MRRSLLVAIQCDCTSYSDQAIRSRPAKIAGYTYCVGAIYPLDGEFYQFKLEMLKRHDNTKMRVMLNRRKEASRSSFLISAGVTREFAPRTGA